MMVSAARDHCMVKKYISLFSRTIFDSKNEMTDSDAKVYSL